MASLVLQGTAHVILMVRQVNLMARQVNPMARLVNHTTSLGHAIGLVSYTKG